MLLDLATNLLVIRLALKELAQYTYIRYYYGTSMPYLTNIWNMLEVGTRPATPPSHLLPISYAGIASLPPSPRLSRLPPEPLPSLTASSVAYFGR